MPTERSMWSRPFASENRLHGRKKNFPRFKPGICQNRGAENECVWIGSDMYVSSGKEGADIKRAMGILVKYSKWVADNVDISISINICSETLLTRI